MTSREARTARRAEERKAAKLARKSAATQNGFVSQNPAAPSEASRFVPRNARAPNPRRAETNRRNALHSTGPRTSNGKLASSRNSLKHGLASGTLIIPGGENGVDEKRTGCSGPVVRDLNENGLSLLLRYQTTHDRAFYKALNTLDRLQRERRKSEIGFVSQNSPAAPPNDGFVPQNALN